MKYAAFAVNDKGIPGEKLSPILDGARDAEDWWVTNALDPDNNEIVPEYADKNPHMYPVSDDGLPLEQVPDNEAQLASEDARQLMAENVDASLAMSAMIEARRLYAFGLTELSRIVEADDSLHDMTMEVMIQTAGYQAGQAFDSRMMLVALEQATLPWAKKITEKMEDDESNERRRSTNELELKRRAQDVPIGISTEHAGPMEMERSNPIILAGDALAVNVLLDHVQTTALTSKVEGPPKVFTVVRCSAFATDPPKLDPNIRLVTVPKRLWLRSTTTANGFAEAMVKYVYDCLNSYPDLLIIDDLKLTQDYDEGREGTACGEALKRVTDWCKEVGCGLVAGIHLTGSPDLSSYKWERVNKFSTLRPVSVSADEAGNPDMRRITVGWDAFSLDVNKDTLVHPDLVI